MLNHLRFKKKKKTNQNLSEKNYWNDKTQKQYPNNILILQQNKYSAFIHVME